MVRRGSVIWLPASPAACALWAALFALEAWAGASQHGLDEPAPAATSQPAARPAASRPTSAPAAQAELSPAEFDFGEAWQFTSIQREFTLRNTGNVPLTLGVRTDCACTLVATPKSPLSPGESCTFLVSYDSKRVGEARKAVRLSTNDPHRPEIVVPIRGTVKRLVVFTPDQYFSFPDLEVSSAETRVLKMESQYDRPLKLRLKEGEDHGVFEVSLTETRSGREYELTARTRPPLAMGLNRTEITLVPDVEDLAPMTVYANAQVNPPVLVSPTWLVVDPAWGPGVQRTLLVKYRVGTPLKITEVKCDIPGMKWEVAGAPSPATGEKREVWQIRVTLPPFDQIPAAGGTMELFTDYADKEYQRLSIAIKRAAAKEQPPN